MNIQQVQRQLIRHRSYRLFKVKNRTKTNTIQSLIFSVCWNKKDKLFIRTEVALVMTRNPHTSLTTINNHNTILQWVINTIKINTYSRLTTSSIDYKLSILIYYTLTFQILKCRIQQVNAFLWRHTIVWAMYYFKESTVYI